MKKYLFVLMGLFLSLGSQAYEGPIIPEIPDRPMPLILDVERYRNGKPIIMNQVEAIRYCAGKGARLPSARELARFAHSLGSVGIVTECGTYPKCRKLINIRNLDGSVEEFYFIASGFPLRPGNLSPMWTWSSSMWGNSSGFDFKEGTGEIGLDWDGANKGVRCAVDR